LGPCYEEHRGSNGVKLEKIFPIGTVRAQYLRHEWQCVGLSQTTHTGIPGDLTGVM